jgi:cyclopropane-fatty-acyl-phospholipid synthase
MDGWWECDRLDELFFRICKHRLDRKFYRSVFDSLRTAFAHVVNFQTKLRSLQVAEEHYNLGNDLYERMLGPTMAYTCGYWKDAKTLDEAQNAKFDLICRKIGLKRGEKVLELGCGFGTFAKFAAQNYGCSIAAVHISEEQVKYGRAACSNLPVRFYQCDYRDSHIYNKEKELFDKVVSIGLLEHVGHKNYLRFAELIRNNLKEEGLCLVHSIGKDVTTSHIDPWISKYIFPNSILPSIQLLAKAFEGIFVVEDLHNFGADYDKTLMAWHANFVHNWDDLKHEFDDKFYRKWEYYLLSCAGAFRARTMQLWQFVLSPKGVLGGYESIR